MAGLLALLPGLLGAVEKTGIIGKAADVAGGILKDVAEGRVGSWGDFGKSLAAGGARALGRQVLPLKDSYPSPSHERVMADVNKVILDNSRNAADQHIIMSPAEPELMKIQMPKKPYEAHGVPLPFTRLGDTPTIDSAMHSHPYANDYPHQHPSQHEPKRDLHGNLVPQMITDGKKAMILPEQQTFKQKYKKKKFKKLEKPDKKKKKK